MAFAHFAWESDRVPARQPTRKISAPIISIGWTEAGGGTFNFWGCWTTTLTGWAFRIIVTMTWDRTMEPKKKKNVYASGPEVWWYSMGESSATSNLIRNRSGKMHPSPRTIFFNLKSLHLHFFLFVPSFQFD